MVSTATRWTKRLIKNCDRYPKTVTLSYKGKDTFPTLVGGIYSLIILGLLVTYGYILFLRMHNRESSQITKTTTVVNLNNNPDEHFVGRNGIMIAVLVTLGGNDQPQLPDQTLFSFVFEQGIFIDLMFYDCVLTYTDQVYRYACVTFCRTLTITF